MLSRTLREIASACCQLPARLYREEGLAFAVIGTLSMPVAVPIAALFYFRIGKEHRDILDEWRSTQ